MGEILTGHFSYANPKFKPVKSYLGCVKGEDADMSEVAEEALAALCRPLEGKPAFTFSAAAMCWTTPCSLTLYRSRMMRLVIILCNMELKIILKVRRTTLTALI